MTDLEPSHYYKNAEIILQTAHQTLKDFGMLNHKISFSGNTETAYQELFEQIEPLVAKLIQKNYQQLLDLLYRIDVNEKKVSEMLKSENKVGENFANKMTTLILNRELQKVIIRNTYSLKGNQNLEK